MSAPRYIVGIDLGTTHTVVAWAEARAGAKVEPFSIAQAIAPFEVAARPLLPSNVYIPAGPDLPPGAAALPWDPAPELVVGELARAQGARVPGRLVASAKSWLCHGGVDREAAILPWAAAEGVRRLSPVEASALYLGHVRAAWDHAHPDAPLGGQWVVLTVPASFDEEARALTVEAARRAGLDRLVLIEEPQAAFYDWMAGQEDLEAALGGARTVLVVDVGGGTTDLTLIRAGPGGALIRVAVGDHLMLGGDNMDLALARLVEPRLGALDARAWTMLVHAARQAKEALLAADAPAARTITVLGGGARLLGGARSAELTRAEVMEAVLEGFFPRVDATASPERVQRGGFLERGLPYARDTAVPKHVAEFLRRHARAAGGKGAIARPDAILLNGGVFAAGALGDRLCQVIASWFPDQPPPVRLRAERLDSAVARGAAWYGLARAGFGRRIGGGSARAYYVGVAGGAICVAPRGMEEGSAQDVPGHTFLLTVGKPVSFPLFASSDERGDVAGTLAPPEELRPLSPLHVVLDSRGGGTRAGEIPVTLRAALTEVGTLELWCLGPSPSDRWRLEFGVRGESAEGGAALSLGSLPRRFDEARALVERVYGKKPQPVEIKEVKGLFRELEKVLGERESWAPATLRALWSTLWAGAQKRRRTPDHERVWFQLCGYCLRPGYGAPLDAWRTEQVWTLFQPGIQFHTEKASWVQWWILWRRVAGGLDARAQEEILAAVRPYLEPPTGRAAPKPRGPRAEGLDEMVRLVANLERLPASSKAEVGEWLWARPELGGPLVTPWAIGRLGARAPVYGSAHAVIAPETASAWVERLLALDWKRYESAPFAAAMVAQVTGDRALDLDPQVRERVAARLAAAGAPAAWLRMVREVVALADADARRAYGESLPPGLRLYPGPS